MSKVILFDLDDTILDFHKSEYEALKKTLLSFGIDPTDEMISYYSEVNDSQWKLLEKGLLTREEVLVRRFEIFFEGIGRSDCDPEETWHRYEKNLSQSWFFVDGAKELLEELHTEYDLYIVSNGTASVQKGRIDGSSIRGYFKKIFISQNVGHNKPDKRFFEKCFAEIDDFKKDDCVIVGDSLTSDIQGGINSCIKTIWFNRNNAVSVDGIKPDYEITSLDMLPIVLGMIFESNE